MAAYTIFYLTIFRIIEGGGWNSPPRGPYGTEIDMTLRGLKKSKSVFLFIIVLNSL